MALPNPFRLFANLFPAKAARTPFDPNVASSQSALYDWYAKLQHRVVDRATRYQEYDKVDCEGISHSILDLHADSICQYDLTTGKTVWPVSRNPVVKKIIDDLFLRIGLEDNCYSLVRSMCKYGDDFELTLTSEENGIEQLYYMSPAAINRKTDDFGVLRAYITEEGGVEIAPWYCVHWKMPSSDRSQNYGDSIFTSTLMDWRRLRMAEDQELLGQLRNSGAKDVWSVEVGGVSSNEAQRRVLEFSQQMTRKQYTDQQSRLRTDMDAYSVDDTFYIPMVDGKPLHKFDRVPAQPVDSNIVCVTYFLKRFFSDMRVPPSYFGFDSGDGHIFDYSKALIQQDLRFSRTCKKIQRAFLVGLVQLCKIQLCYKGLDPNDATNGFSLVMVPVTILEETQRNELIKLRIELAQQISRFASEGAAESDPPILDNKSWLSWILSDICLFDDQLIQHLLPKDKRKELEGTQPLSDGHKRAIKKTLTDSQRDTVLHQFSSIGDSAATPSLVSDKFLRPKRMSLVEFGMKKDEPSGGVVGELLTESGE